MFFRKLYEMMACSLNSCFSICTNCRLCCFLPYVPLQNGTIKNLNDSSSEYDFFSYLLDYRLPWAVLSNSTESCLFLTFGHLEVNFHRVVNEKCTCSFWKAPISKLKNKHFSETRWVEALLKHLLAGFLYHDKLTLSEVWSCCTWASVVASTVLLLSAGAGTT